MKKRLIVGVSVVCLFFAGLVLMNLAYTQTAPRRIEIHAKRFSFTPNEVTLKKGEPVVLVITSDDVPHGLRFKELNLDLKAPKGGTAQKEFTPQRAGDFVGHCSVFCGSGHGSMTLTLHVAD